MGRATDVVYIVLSFLFLVLVICVLYALTIGTFSLTPANLSNVISSIPIPSESFLNLMQGILTFVSIMFGFYAVILTVTLRPIIGLFKRIIPKIANRAKKIYSVIFAFLLFIMLILPIYSLIIAASNSFIAIGYNGKLNAYYNQTLYTKTVTDVKGVIGLTFTSGELILLELIIYTVITFGIVDYVMHLLSDKSTTANNNKNPEESGQDRKNEVSGVKNNNPPSEHGKKAHNS